MVPSREYPKAYVDSAGGTYEEYVWVLERLRGPAGNNKWKCNFCATERNGQRISIAAHVTGMKFGYLQIKACPTAPTDVKAKIIQEEEAKKNHVEYEAFLEELYSPSD